MKLIKFGNYLIPAKRIKEVLIFDRPDGNWAVKMRLGGGESIDYLYSSLESAKIELEKIRTQTTKG